MKQRRRSPFRRSSQSAWSAATAVETVSRSGATTGALYSAFDRLRDHVGPAGSSKRQPKVNHLRLPLWSRCEAQSLEQL
jgi:hypothetical protein